MWIILGGLALLSILLLFVLVSCDLEVGGETCRNVVQPGIDWESEIERLWIRDVIDRRGVEREIGIEEGIKIVGSGLMKERYLAGIEKGMGEDELVRGMGEVRDWLNEKYGYWLSGEISEWEREVRGERKNSTDDAVLDYLIRYTRGLEEKD